MFLELLTFTSGSFDEPLEKLHTVPHLKILISGEECKEKDVAALLLRYFSIFLPSPSDAIGQHGK